jgi:hypothetical protein
MLRIRRSREDDETEAEMPAGVDVDPAAAARVE